MDPQQNLDVVALLQQHEEQLARVYEACAWLLPEHESFWRRLVVEERAHAELLQTLSQRIASGEIQEDLRSIHCATVQTCLEHLKRKQWDIESNGITHLQALVMAQDVENTILEKDFFCVFRPQTPLMVEEFRALAAHTKEHAALLRAELEKEKHNAGEKKRADHGYC